MNFEPTRKRREVSPATINLLRLFGWRFSFTRAAWVHRFRKGRYGPVFVVRDDVTRPADSADQTGFAVVTVAESAVAEAEAAVSAAAAAAAAPAPTEPLPRRTPGSRPPTSTGEAAPSPEPSEPIVDVRRDDPAVPTPTATEPAAADAPTVEPAVAAPTPEPTPEPSPWKVDGRPTLPRPRTNPTELRSVPGGAKRASA